MCGHDGVFFYEQNCIRHFLGLVVNQKSTHDTENKNI